MDQTEHHEKFVDLEEILHEAQDYKSLGAVLSIARSVAVLEKSGRKVNKN